MEICSSGKLNEYLAQRKSHRKNYERDVEKENAERRRLVPFHMHINTDLVDCCHLLSAMLLEAQASGGVAESGELISRTFRRMAYAADRQVFTGPPENVKEHIIACFRSLNEGDWRQACGYILDLPLWDLMSNPASVKQMLKTKIKHESLRTYLLTNAHHYDALNLQVLCDMFELEDREVRRIVGRMILGRELNASWNENNLVMLQAVPTSLQSLSLQFSDRLRKLVENNESSMDRLTGGGSRETEARSGSSGRGGRGGGGRGGGGFRKDWYVSVFLGCQHFFLSLTWLSLFAGGTRGDDNDRRQGGGRGAGSVSNVIGKGFRAGRSSRR